MAACNNPGDNRNGAPAGTLKQTIAVNEFEQKMNSAANAQIIDVRTPEEYTGGHLKNARNINIHDDSFEAQLAKLDKSKPVFVY